MRIMTRVIVFILFLSCVFAPAAAEGVGIPDAEAIAMAYFSRTTGIPEYILSAITAIRTYDMVSDWYTVLLYQEPLIPSAADANYADDPLIMCSVYIRKTDAFITDVQNNQGSSLFHRIVLYRIHPLTKAEYLRLVYEWETIFGPSYTWQYELEASFQLIYHTSSQEEGFTFSEKPDEVELLEDIYTFNEPYAVFYTDSVIPYEVAYQIAVDTLTVKTGLKKEYIKGMQLRTLLERNKYPNEPFYYSGKYSKLYWVFVFSENGKKKYSCQILEDSTVEQIYQLVYKGNKVVDYLSLY